MSSTEMAATALRSSTAAAPLSLYHLLEPEVLANPYPLYLRLRTEDPVHWDPYLHAWVVTRYHDVATVFRRFSAERTPPPEYFEALGVPEVGPIAQMMVRQMLFLDAPAHTLPTPVSDGWQARRSNPHRSARCARTSRTSQTG